MPNLWIPKQVHRVDSIPVLASGKLDFKKCKELAAESSTAILAVGSAGILSATGRIRRGEPANLRYKTPSCPSGKIPVLRTSNLIFLFQSPGRNSAKEVACRAGNISAFDTPLSINARPVLNQIFLTTKAPFSRTIRPRC